MPISYRVIGRHIRDARHGAGLTQEALAEKLEMSSAHLGKIERGERAVNMERLSQISILLNVPIEFLVAGSVVGASQDFPTQVSTENEFLTALAALSQGCSEQSRKLMLRLCREVVEYEK